MNTRIIERLVDNYLLVVQEIFVLEQMIKNDDVFIETVCFDSETRTSCFDAVFYNFLQREHIKDRLEKLKWKINIFDDAINRSDFSLKQEMIIHRILCGDSAEEIAIDLNLTVSRFYQMKKSIIQKIKQVIDENDRQNLKMPRDLEESKGISLQV